GALRTSAPASSLRLSKTKSHTSRSSGLAKVTRNSIGRRTPISSQILPRLTTGSTRLNLDARARFGFAGVRFRLAEGFFVVRGLFVGRGFFVVERLRSFFFAMLPLELLQSVGCQPKRKNRQEKSEQTSRVTRM